MKITIDGKEYDVEGIKESCTLNIRNESILKYCLSWLDINGNIDKPKKEYAFDIPFVLNNGRKGVLKRCVVLPIEPFEHSVNESKGIIQDVNIVYDYYNLEEK